MDKYSQALISIGIFFTLYVFVWYWAKQAIRDANKKAKGIYVKKVF